MIHGQRVGGNAVKITLSVFRSSVSCTLVAMALVIFLALLGCSLVNSEEVPRGVFDCDPAEKDCTWQDEGWSLVKLPVQYKVEKTFPLKVVPFGLQQLKNSLLIQYDVEIEELVKSVKPSLDLDDTDALLKLKRVAWSQRVRMILLANNDTLLNQTAFYVLDFHAQDSDRGILLRCQDVPYTERANNNWTEHKFIDLNGNAFKRFCLNIKEFMVYLFFEMTIEVGNGQFQIWEDFNGTSLTLNTTDDSMYEPIDVKYFTFDAHKEVGLNINSLDKINNSILTSPVFDYKSAICFEYRFSAASQDDNIQVYLQDNRSVDHYLSDIRPYKVGDQFGAVIFQLNQPSQVRLKLNATGGVQILQIIGCEDDEELAEFRDTESTNQSDTKKSVVDDVTPISEIADLTESPDEYLKQSSENVTEEAENVTETATNQTRHGFTNFVSSVAKEVKDFFKNITHFSLRRPSSSLPAVEVEFIKVHSQSSNSVIIEWEPFEEEQDEVVTYNVSYYCKKRLGCNSPCPSQEVTELEITDRNSTLEQLLPFTEYFVTVTGNGWNSTVVISTTMGVPLEIPKYSKKKTEKHGKDLTVFWNPVKVCSAALKGYMYQVFKAGNTRDVLTSGCTNKTEATIKVLPKTDYTIRVFIVNAIGWNEARYLEMNVTASDIIKIASFARMLQTRSSSSLQALPLSTTIYIVIIVFYYSCLNRMHV